MMNIPFSKMQGLGNDFVVFYANDLSAPLTPAQVRKVANRRFGIGCDQVLLVRQAETANVDFEYRIYNSDGGEVEHCGNGARCFFKYVHEKGLTDKTSINVSTLNGLITLSAAADNMVTVDMGEPIFEPQAIPFTADSIMPSYCLELENESLEIGAVSLGNPHALIRVDNVNTAELSRLGPMIENHPRFPKRVNVGFMQIIDQERIRLRVFERGVGETLACGTGACAAVAVGNIQGLLSSKVSVELLGGEMVIEWAGRSRPMLMTGPGETVFEGSIEL